MVVCAMGKEKSHSNQTIIPKRLTFRIEKALFENNSQAGTAADILHPGTAMVQDTQWP